jgi:hypothetical protein
VICVAGSDWHTIWAMTWVPRGLLDADSAVAELAGGYRQTEFIETITICTTWDIPSLLAPTRRVPARMEPWTWSATCTSGGPTGTPTTTTHAHQPAIPRDPTRVLLACTGVVRSMGAGHRCVPPSAMAGTPISGARPSASGSPWIPLPPHPQRPSRRVHPLDRQKPRTRLCCPHAHPVHLLRAARQAHLHGL